MSAVEKNEGAEPCMDTAPFIKNESLYEPIVTFNGKISNLEAAQFLKFFAEDEGITFQTFSDAKGQRNPQLTRVLHGSLQQYLAELTQLNQQGAGIFFTVNATDLKGRETKNITRVRAVFVDLDGAPLEPVLAALLPPHIVVESSPKRFHA